MKPTSISDQHSELLATDRRALSEAWHAALHGAPRERMATHKSTQAGSAAAPARGTAQRSPGSRPCPAPSASIAAHASRRAPPRGTSAAAPAPADTRARGRTIAAAIVARARRAPLARRSAFTLALADGSRVHLLVQRAGVSLSLRAVCAAAAGESVSRALACAVSDLERCGLAVRSAVTVTMEEA
jgi:hypothetical protein